MAIVEYVVNASGRHFQSINPTVVKRIRRKAYYLESPMLNAFAVGCSIPRTSMSRRYSTHEIDFNPIVHQRMPRSGSDLATDL